MWRTLRIALLACLLPIATAVPASATPPSDVASSLALSALWSKIFETPNPQNPLGAGGAAYSCVQVTPSLLSAFGSGSVPGCTVNRTTTLLVTPYASECSTFENSTPAELRRCAIQGNARITGLSLAIDGKPVAFQAVQTILIPIVLPANNVFGAPTGAKGLSVGDGWVTLVRLTPGLHSVHTTASGFDGSGNVVNSDNITIFNVR